MRIAVPSESTLGLASLRSGHFGHAPYFTVIELNDETKEVEKVEVAVPPEHGEGGCGNIIDFVIGLGIDAILAAGMGRPPLMRFNAGGVTVYFDQTQPVVGAALALVVAGQCPIMGLENACNHHDHN